MRRALALARRGRFTVAPNPCVGAVALDPSGAVVGEGWHRRAGEPHAEVHALAAAGPAARGGTMVVTLEPCNHHGRTPPCVDALIVAGVARVVAAHRDPDPRTSGGGLRRLAAAGIEASTGTRAEEAIELNLPFLVSTLFGRPSVTLKWAASLDGRTATTTGESQWITGPAARDRALDLREEHDAILVGSETVARDDPRLDRRRGRADGPIVRVVLDRRLRTAPDARLFGVEGRVLLYTESSDRARLDALTGRGAEVVRLERVDPAGVLADLAGRGVRSVLVEGGGRVAAAFFEAEAWDRVVAFVAPRLIGGAAAPSPLAGAGFGSLAEAPEVARWRVRRAGRDLEIQGVRSACLRDLSSSVAG